MVDRISQITDAKTTNTKMHIAREGENIDWPGIAKVVADNSGEWAQTDIDQRPHLAKADV